MTHSRGPARDGLAASGLSKSFGGVRALDRVDFDVRPGEIHALVGENGAGKSTLIKILAGAVVPDSGAVTLDGAPLPRGNAPATRRLGVSCVHQEFTLVPDLDVADNIFLGREHGGWLLQRTRMRREAQAQLDALGVHVLPQTRVRALSVPQQQLVEIARAVASDAKVLILDEPTASLTGADVTRLFGLLRTLRDRGVAIVYISHRLEEIFDLATRVTVLRDGRTVATAAIGEVDRATLIRWMVGRDLAEEFPARDARRGDLVLEVQGLSCGSRFTDVSLDLHAGEVVGLAGLAGAGRSSVGLALAGALRATGQVRLKGAVLDVRSPSRALAAGIAYVTEDRKGHGLFPQMAARANITITSLRAFTRAGVLSLARERAAAAGAARDFDVRAAHLEQSASTLSGGNQQKLLLARYLLEPRSVVILDEPTRGVDVGARAEIYKLIDRLTRDGLGVLMISSDLNEVLGMSDRIVVMRQGRVAGALARDAATPERVMQLATGIAA